jgi:hypothetical protein
MKKLTDRLSRATPPAIVRQWLLLSLLYAFATLASEHFELIASIGLSAKQEAIIRLAGLYCYILITTFQFQRTKHRSHESK